METLQRTANRGSLSTGYDINNSVKMESDNTEFLTRSVSSASNRRTWTYSTWIKITETGINNYFLDAYKNSNTWFILGISDVGRLVFYDIIVGTDYGKQTNRLLRDTSAWYHIVFVSDTTNSTSTDRYRLYINGIRETSFATDYGDPPVNYDGNVNDAIAHNVGKRTDGPYYFNGYLAETVLVDGTALDPDSFGETDSDTGIWKPIDVSGLTFGTNGFYLDYEDAANLGDDVSGNSNNFTENNITSADQATDTPTNNFATTNPILKYFTETFTTEGGTVVTKNANGWIAPQSTICPASGKWYMEFKFNAVDSRILGAAPIGGTLWDSATHYGGGVGSDSVGYADTGYLYVNDSGVNPVFGPTYGNSNIMAIALDMDNGYIYWAKDNTWINSADPVAGSGGYALPAGLVEHSIGASVYQQAKQSFANFGGYTTISISSAATDANGYGTFEYAPPSGYYALCSKNLAEYG